MPLLSSTYQLPMESEFAVVSVRFRPERVKTGNTLLLGTVKESVKGALLPPDQILYADAFAGGVSADVLLIWRHNLFAQEVFIKSRPELPTEWNPANVRFEVITEFIVDAEPELRTSTVRAEGQPEIEDSSVIDFGAMAIITGKALALSEDKTFTLGAISSDGVSVVKQWQRTADGRRFLVESIPWPDAAQFFIDLPAAQQAGHFRKNQRSTASVAQIDDGQKTQEPEKSQANRDNRIERISISESHPQWPATPAQLEKSEPIQIALIDYQPKGCLIDFTTIPAGAGTPTTFESGQTYYIPTNYYSGSATTFEPGTVIKYKTNAYMLVYGPLTFPDTHQTPVFTSRNDDSFGEKITNTGITGETDSDGNPALHIAAKALWVYYDTSTVTIQNARIRYAKIGIQNDRNSWETATQTVRDCVFENITGTGSFGVSGDQSNMTVSNLKKNNVSTSGASMADLKFYPDQSFKGIYKYQAHTGVPDSMGAVDGTNFVEIVNGYIKVFNKTNGVGVAGEEFGMNTFFFGTVTTNIMTDPRIIYDSASGRWIASALYSTGTQFELGYVKLAVSKNSNPTSLSNNWDHYTVDVSDNSAWYADWDTLAIDANGVYITVIYYHDTLPGIQKNKVIAISKSNLYSGTLTYTNKSVTTNELNAETIFPVRNYNSSPTGGYVWFLSQAKAGGTGAGYQPGNLYYRRGYWTNSFTAFEWADANWVSVGTNATRYFALDDAGVDAPQLDSPPSIKLEEIGSRIVSAVLRGTNLWACQAVGLDGTDGDYDGTESGSTVDRTGIQWWRLGLASDGSAITSKESGIIYDADTTPSHVPYWYYTPSLAVNGSGYALMAFSGSKSTEYVGCFYYGRSPTGSFPDRVMLLQPGSLMLYGGENGRSRWGDYSATVIDPSDDSKFWTVQEYSDETLNEGDGYWTTWIGSIKLSQ